LCARQVRSVPGELSMDTNAVLRLAQATGHVAKPQLTQARARRERQEAAKRMRVTRLDATRQCCLSVRTMLGAQAYAPCVCVQGEHFMGCSLSERLTSWVRFAVHAVAQGL